MGTPNSAELTVELNELDSLADMIRHLDSSTLRLEKENDTRELKAVEAALARLKPVVKHLVQFHAESLKVSPAPLEPAPETKRTLPSWAVVTEKKGMENCDDKQLIISRGGDLFVLYLGSSSCSMTNAYMALTTFGLEQILAGVKNLLGKKVEQMKERVVALEARRDRISAAIKELGG